MDVIKSFIPIMIQFMQLAIDINDLRDDVDWKNYEENENVQGI